MGNCFRLPVLGAQHRSGCSIECRENTQLRIRRGRTEEGCQIKQKIRRKFKRAGDMLDRLLPIIAQDGRVCSQRPGTVHTVLLQARHACQSEIGVIHNEHSPETWSARNPRRTAGLPATSQCRREGVSEQGG